MLPAQPGVVGSGEAGRCLKRHTPAKGIMGCSSSKQAMERGQEDEKGDRKDEE